MLASRILVIQLGSKNAGPSLAVSLAESLDNQKLLAGVVLSKSCELDITLLKKFDGRVFSVSTYNNILSLILRVMGSIYLKKDLAKILVSTNPNLIILPMQHLLDFVIFNQIKKINRKMKIPVISWVHDVDPHPGDSKLLTKFMMTNTLKHSTAFVVLSNLVKNRLLRLTAKPILQIAHPIQVQEFESENQISPTSGKILFSGRLLKYKGIERMSLAWDLILREFPGWQLIVAGTGDDDLVRENFRTKQNCQLITRYLSKEEMHNLFFSSDIIAIPYDESSQSGILAQAVAFGKPYVITPVEGLKEQHQILGGGFMAEDMTPESFAKGVINIIRNESNLLPSRAATFSWNSQTFEMISQIKCLDSREIS
jgi:glycosyltransferase involved in cell wall biosynthesis